MTFDDGIVSIYDVSNGSQPGELPMPVLVLALQEYFHKETIGVTRFYEALKAEKQIDLVISIHEADVSINQIAVIDDKQFVIQMAQDAVDDDGLKITRLTLERSGELYEYA